MGFNRLPSNSEKLLLEIVNTDNASQLLCNLIEQASSTEDDELRGIIRELRQEGNINVKWADNIPYFVTLNNSARTYKEQLAEFETQTVIQAIKDKKVKPIIFISHRSTDKAIADMLVDYFSGTGIPKDIIFCSSLFDEFESYETAESRFAHAMDNIQPLILNNSNNGSDWKGHNVTSEQIYKRHSKTKLGSEKLYEIADRIIQENIQKGNIKN